MSDQVQELNEKDIQSLPDNELIAMAEEIVATELKKSSDIKGAKEDPALGPTEGDIQPDKNQGSKGEAPQEANPKNKKKVNEEEEEGEMKKSQAAIEGSETGGLAPSVQGNLPTTGNGSKGDAQDTANASPSPNALLESGDMLPEEKERNKNKKKGPTQDGDAQDEANTESKHPAKTEGGSTGGNPTQTGTSQDQANQLGSKNESMKKSNSVAELTKLVLNLTKQVKTLEKSLKDKEDKPLKKSAIFADVAEKLSKSYLTQIEGVRKEKEELQKSFDARFDTQSKQIEELKKSNDTMIAAIKKPARTRDSLTSMQEIRKGNSEDQPQKLYKSKSEVLAKMEELRKSGKVNGDEVISFNASGFLTENAKKHLFQS